MKTSQTIIGTYGDPVELFPGGYVYTKYGNFLKIKSVDFEKKEIDFYGDGVLGFSRASCGVKNNKEARKEYIEYLEEYFNGLKIKDGSIINIEIGDTKTSVKLEKIIYPTLQNDDYLPKLQIEGKRDLLIIDNFSEFSRMVVVEFTPYSLEEKLANLLDEHSNFNGGLKDKKEYLKDLIKLVKTEIK